jgi:hypothetical protein
MPEEKKKKKEIKTDEVVDRLLEENKTAGVIKLAGRYLGNSEHKDSYRLYLTDQLNHYLEFPKQATLEAERFPSGGIVVWLKEGTKVRETKTTVVIEDFLRGDIHSSNAGSGRGGSVLRGVLRLAENAPKDCCISGGKESDNCSFGCPSPPAVCNPPRNP